MNTDIPVVVGLTINGLAVAFLSSLLYLYVWEPHIEGLGGRWIVNITFFLFFLTAIGYLIVGGTALSIGQGGIGAAYLVFGVIALIPTLTWIYKFSSGERVKYA